MQKISNSSNIKIQMNNFTLNLQTLQSQENDQNLSTTQRKKTKTHRTKSNFEEISPMKVKKKTKQKQHLNSKIKLKTQSISQSNNVVQKHSKLNKQKRQREVAPQQLINTKNERKSNKANRSKSKKQRTSKLERHFTEYNQVVQSARITPSPSLNMNNYKFNSKSIQKSASRSRSKSHKNPNNQKSKQKVKHKKSRSKSIFSTNNQRLNTYRSTQKMRHKKSRQIALQTQKSNKKQYQKSRQRLSIDNCRKHLKSKLKSKQRINTQNSQRQPLDNKHFNSNLMHTDRYDLSHKKSKNQNNRVTQTAMNNCQSFAFLGQKFTSNKFSQKEKKQSKTSKIKTKKTQTTISLSDIHKVQKTQKVKRIKTAKKQPIKTYKKLPTTNNQHHHQLNNYIQPLIDQGNRISQQGFRDLCEKTTQRKSKRVKTQSYNCDELDRNVVASYGKSLKNNDQVLIQKAFRKKKTNNIIQKLFSETNRQQNHQYLNMPKNKESQQNKKSDERSGIKKQNKISSHFKKLTIQTQLQKIQNKQKYFDDLSKILRKHNHSNSISEGQRNSVVFSQKSIKEEIMEDSQQKRQKKLNMSNLSSQQNHRQNCFENQARCQDFNYLLNEKNMWIQKQQKDFLMKSINSQERDIRQISSNEMQSSQNQEQSNQKQSQNQDNQSQNQGNQQNQESQQNQNQSQIQDNQSEEEQIVSFKRSNFPHQQNQIDLKKILDDQQKKDLDQFFQANIKIQSYINQKNDQIIDKRDEKSLRYHHTQFRYQISQHRETYLGKQIQNKPKSMQLIDFPVNKTQTQNSKIDRSVRQHTIKGQTDIIQTFTSSTLIESQPHKRSPLLSPSSYAFQNKQKMKLTLNKPRKSIQQQFNIAKSLSNKKLREQLGLLQTLQKSLQNSLILDMNHNLCHKGDKAVLPKGAQDLHTVQKGLILQSCKDQGSFSGLDVGFDKGQKVGVKSVLSPKGKDVQLQLFQRQDSPLLSNEDNSLRINQSYLSRVVDGQKTVNLNSSSLEKQVRQFRQGEQFMRNVQISPQGQKQNAEDDESSLSLYHQRNMLKLKKNEYSQLSLEFQKEMEQYLKDNSDKSIQSQLKSKTKDQPIQKQQANNSALSNQFFYYGKSINNTYTKDPQQITSNSKSQPQSHNHTSTVKQADIKYDNQKQPAELAQNPSELIKSQIISFVLNVLMSQFTVLLNSKKNILHKFLFYVSNSNLVMLQDRADENGGNTKQEQRNDRQVNQEQFQEYLQSRIQAGNNYISHLSHELLTFIRNSQQHSNQFLKNINKSFGLKPLKTLKWMRKAFTQNDNHSEQSQQQNSQNSQNESVISQSQQIQAVLSPIMLADYDAYQNQMIFEHINQQQYYLNHAVYATLNQICDTLRPYGESGPPVMPKCKAPLNTSIQSLQPKIISRFQTVISLRMGRSSFSPDQQPQKIITQSYINMDQMIVAEQQEKWTDRNLEDMIFESQYYLALQIVDLIFNQQALEILKVTNP